MRRKRHVPDLTRLGALAEANYQRLSRLLRMAQEGELVLTLAHGDRYLGEVSLRQQEQGKYTDTYLLEQTQASGPWLNNPKLVVRLYHDARMAEVLSCWRHERVLLEGAYPNSYMQHPDEKTQVNAFLAEWLSFCLRFGLSRDPLHSSLG